MSPSKRGRPSREQSRELGERIVAQAVVLFRTDGYEATTIEGLAKELGCSKHTIYRRFSDKEALFAAALAYDRKFVLARLTRIDLSAGHSVDALKKACHALFELAMEPDSTDLYRACIGAAQKVPAIGRQFMETEKDLQRILELSIQRAQQDGYIVTISARLLAVQLYYAMIGQPFLHSLLGVEHQGTASEQAELFARNWTSFMAAYGTKSR